jgi:F420-dependent oxidoreductase-like protein
MGDVSDVADVVVLPSPCLVVLVGPSGAGKSTWAAAHFTPEQIVSSDRLRAVIGESEDDVAASTDAFTLLESIVEHRVKRRLTTVVDTLGIDVVLAPATVRTAPRTVATAAPLAARQAEAPVSLRFGLQLPVYTWPGGAPTLRDDLRAVARAAEDAGFSSLWVMDHFRQIPMFGPAWHDMLESWTTLSFLAAATERVTLGTLVTGVTYRNVAHLGKIVATLDVLSRGRAVCGLGAGWFADEHRAYGWEFPPLAERYALLEDALELLPLLWGKGTPAFKGRVIEVPEAMCYPRPLQARVPILVGGNGERRTLRLVAQYADMCNVIGDLATVERKTAVLDAHCQELGRDRAEIEVTQLSTTLVGRDGEELDGLLERLRPRRSSAQRYAERVNAGTVADQVGRFRSLADAGVGTAIVSLPDLDGPAAVERFAAVIAAFT